MPRRHRTRSNWESNQIFDRIEYYLNRIRERLWVKPLLASFLSVAGLFAAKAVDRYVPDDLVPEIAPGTNESLLAIMASSMLVIATFAVASIVAAYSSAGTTATPRSFPLIVSDDVSQTALSSFIGAFIFSIVSLIAVSNNYYDHAGHFAIFVLIIAIFAWVVLTFVRWVDNIARLGRLRNVIDKVETTATRSLDRRRNRPTKGGTAVTDGNPGEPVYGDSVGYIQRIEVGTLQAYAEKLDGQITVAALPGTLTSPGKALAYAEFTRTDETELDGTKILAAFKIGTNRVFDEDPRFGLIVLSEIASRALSPAVNDPGTAIDIIGRFVRLFSLWAQPPADTDQPVQYDRVRVPALSISDMLEDAFTPIARDGAGLIEVHIRLQKAFSALVNLGDPEMTEAATGQSRLALKRAERTLKLQEEIDVLTKLSEDLGRTS